MSFPWGVGTKTRAYVCPKEASGEKGGLGVWFCGCLMHLLTSNQCPHPRAQEPQGCGRVTVARQGSLETGVHGLGHLQQLSSSEGETRIQQRHDPSRRPHLVLALLLQERLPKDREIKGAWG